MGVPGMPSHAVSVISYSVSSDLSHCQSPKMHDVDIGTFDPVILTWESRQQKIRRQLLMYDADIICIQGLQSIGNATRCSESEPGWFVCEDEPTSNHLVHLYRSLSTDNYGVVFAPTLNQPGSEVICLGNAIFWKRSRWQMQKHWSCHKSSICAELLS